MLPKSVAVSKYLLTVTPFSCPEGVTVTEDVCMRMNNWPKFKTAETTPFGAL